MASGTISGYIATAGTLFDTIWPVDPTKGRQVGLPDPREDIYLGTDSQGNSVTITPARYVVPVIATMLLCSMMLAEAILMHAQMSAESKIVLPPDLRGEGFRS